MILEQSEDKTIESLNTRIIGVSQILKQPN